jgi:hypothetical protein
VIGIWAGVGKGDNALNEESVLDMTRVVGDVSSEDPECDVVREVGATVNEELANATSNENIDARVAHIPSGAIAEDNEGVKRCAGFGRRKDRRRR